MDHNFQLQNVSLLQLYDFLRQFHLSDSLYEIGSLNAVYKYGFSKMDERNIPSRFINWLKKAVSERHSEKNLAIVLSRLARFLILSGANDYSKRILEVGSVNFQNALSMIGLTRDEDVEVEFDINGSYLSLIGRLASWQLPLQEVRLNQIARAFILFSDIPSTVSKSYDFNSKMMEYFEIGVQEFIWCGFALLLQTNGTLHETMTIEAAGLKKYVDVHKLTLFRNLSTGSARDYRISLRGGIGDRIVKKVEYYAIDPFLRMPIIKINRSERLSDGSLLVPQAKYLLDRACYGIFHLLSDKEKGNTPSNALGRSGNLFRIAFGEVYKEYVFRQLSTAPANLIIIDFDQELQLQGKNKSPDIAIIGEEICVLLEVKTSLLNLEARTYFDNHELEKEINKPNGNFEKALKQLNTFEERILTRTVEDERFKRVSRVIKILVCYEEIPMLNLLVLPLLKKHFGECTENLQLANVGDIEIMGTLLDAGGNLPSLLARKLDSSEFRAWMIKTYLSENFERKRQNRILQGRFRELMHDIGIQGIDAKKGV